MKLLLALLMREFRADPRRKWFYLKRMAPVSLGSLVVGSAIGEMGYGGPRAVGLTILGILGGVAIVPLGMYALGSSAWSVMKEKEDRTLGLLLATGVNAKDIVYAKLGTSVLYALLGLASLLPVFLLCVGLGGVSSLQVLSVFFLLTCVIVLTASVGIVGASIGTTEHTLSAVVIPLLFALFALPPLAMLWFCILVWKNDPQGAFFGYVSPFAAMAQICEGEVVQAFVCGSLCLLLVHPFMSLAGRFLQRHLVTEGKKPLKAKLKERMEKVPSLASAIPWMEKPPLEGNPVFWKDLHFYHGGGRRGLMKFTVSFVAMALGTIVWILLAQRQYYRYNLIEFIEILAGAELFLCATVFGLGSIQNCGMAFFKERQRQTLPVLLTSGLTNQQIIRGKIRAAILAYKHWAIGGSIVLIALGLAEAVVGRMEGEAFLMAAWLVAEYAMTVTGACGIALWASLRLKRNSGLALAILVSMLWTMFVRFPFLGMGAASAFAGLLVVDAIFHAILIVGFVSKVDQDLRLPTPVVS